MAATLFFLPRLSCFLVTQPQHSTIHIERRLFRSNVEKSVMSGGQPETEQNYEKGVSSNESHSSVDISDAMMSSITEKENSEHQDKMKIQTDGLFKDNRVGIDDILDHIQNCPAVFKSQQIGDPELTKDDKRLLAESLLSKSPISFLVRFGPYLNEQHLQYFSSHDNPEVVEQAKQLLISYHQCNKKVIQKNRRYEALKQLEAEGIYFSESEMEKREPLLYHQLVGQFLTEKEVLNKNRESMSGLIPTFSNFLIDKMERDEVLALRKSQEEAENCCDDEMSDESSEEQTVIHQAPRWGDDWTDAENAVKQKNKKKHKKQKMVHLSSKEKALLFEEFKSLMYSKFLNGLDTEFNYNDVDSNPEFDSLKLRAQDEEDKYFDEESCGSNVCTDTGIEDY